MASSSADPYSGLIAATESDVVLVLIGGRARAGRATLLDPSTPGVELIHVAQQDMVLDLVDDPKSPMANVTLQGSIATLIYALEHLPDIAMTFQIGQAHLEGLARPLQVRLEMDEAHALAAVSGATPIGPGDVDPMTLDPITAVDDTTFVTRLRNNPNLPQWLKNGL